MTTSKLTIKELKLVVVCLTEKRLAVMNNKLGPLSHFDCETVARDLMNIINKIQNDIFHREEYVRTGKK